VQKFEKGAIMIEPSLTNALVETKLALTTKSVPLTPIAATGVFSRNLCRADLAASPEIERATPSVKLNFTAEL
jgi:hypothetical protein